MEGSENDITIPLSDNIPFKHIKYQVYVKLANKLDPDNVVMGNNWRMLADKLGYTMQDIFVFESHQTRHGRNTIKVLQDYGEKAGSTVNELYRALLEIERNDALEELKEALPGIEKSYQESLKESQNKDLMENDCACDSCDPSHPSFPSYQSSHCQKHSLPMKYNIPTSYFPHNAKNYPSHHMSSVDKHYPVRIPGYHHQSPEFKRQKSDSMLVRGHDSHSQMYRDVDLMDHGPSIHEEGIPPHVAIMRDIPRYNMAPDMSINYSGHLQKDAMFRQPASHNSHRPVDLRPQLKLEIPNACEMYNQQRTGGFVSPSPTPSTPSTPLYQLEKMANDSHFQGNKGYQKVLKGEEEYLARKGMPYPGVDYHSQPAQARDYLLDTHQANLAAQNHSKKCNGPPNTFPMRVKQSSSHHLSKSASEPSNMRPAECRQTFRHIKVFVTYAADDNKHTQRVLNLCKCLEKNGFRCCVDIYHRKLPVEDRHDWCINRFDEADFILVVFSNKYHMEVDTCEMDNDADDSDSMDSDGESDRDDISNKLHTKQIYRLMYREYIQSGNRCTRFVPLVFPAMTSDLIPKWMLDQNRRYYSWPKEYKDLLWMLTKPENRVPEHIVPSSSSSRSASDKDAEKMSSDASELSLESE